jgi:hypothetical protein
VARLRLRLPHSSPGDVPCAETMCFETSSCDFTPSLDTLHQLRGGEAHALLRDRLGATGRRRCKDAGHLRHLDVAHQETRVVGLVKLGSRQIVSSLSGRDTPQTMLSQMM